MLLRASVFDKIGLLDDGYFMYYEEVDFFRRARKAGLETWYEPAAHVVHLVGQSSGVTTDWSARRLPGYWFDSRHRYFRKHFGYFGTLAADGAWLTGHVLMRIRRLFTGVSHSAVAKAETGDLLRHSGRRLFRPATAGGESGMTVCEKSEDRSEKSEGGRRKTVDGSQTSEGKLSLWGRVREDYAAHGRDWTKPGFRAVAVHRFGVWRMGIRSKILRGPFSILYRTMFRHVRNHYGIELPYSAVLGRRVVIEHQSGIVIHGNCVVGDDCIIRQGVTLGNRTMEKPLEAPVLGRGVNVGAGAKILGAVRIGDNASIGANAVVLVDVPAGALAVGIPARIILGRAGGGDV